MMTQGGDLVDARPILTETSLLHKKLWVYGIFSDSIKHLSRNAWTASVIGTGAEITFFLGA